MKLLLLTIPEACQSLRIGRTKLYGLIAEGELEIAHIGKSVRITTRSLEKFVSRKARRQPSLTAAGAGGK